MQQKYGVYGENCYNRGMKFFLPFLFILLPFVALAQDAAPKPLHGSNVQIIDGKKFFSLANVRRQESTVLSPAALAVMHNPRTDLRISPANRLVMTPVTGPRPSTNATALPWATESTETPPMPNSPSLPPSPAGLSGAEAQKADLLSIFAPEERPASGYIPGPRVTK